MKKTEENLLLKEVAGEVCSCDRCGACLPECPLFCYKDVEIAGARGKNALARALAEGGIEPSIELLKAVNFCLLCRACTEVCPNKIKTDEAMLNLRQFLIESLGKHNTKHKFAAYILSSRSTVNLLARALSIMRRAHLFNLWPGWMSAEEYFRDKVLSKPAEPAALGSVAPSNEFVLRKVTNVSYFHGCAIKMFFPEVSKETQKRLESTNRLIRKNNACCGLPHLAHGMREKFLDLIKQNIRLYEDADLVVSDCASCSNTLKKSYRYFTGDQIWEKPASAFSSKVMDLTEYLVGAGYSPTKRLPVALTYHDPCHLARGQGITREPRVLLQAAGDFIEMKDSALCCGGAGLFHMDYPDISAKIMAKKLNNLQDSRARVVATACPGCLIQLSRAARYSSTEFKVMHISQVI